MKQRLATLFDAGDAALLLRLLLLGGILIGAAATLGAAVRVFRAIAGV